MTLSDMARKIERHRPGTLDELLNDDLTITYHDHAKFLSDSTERAFHLPDPLAAAILRDAMFMTTNARRVDGGWVISKCCSGGVFRDVFFWDIDHGNCPTRSLFAAFCAAFPEAQ